MKASRILAAIGASVVVVTAIAIERQRISIGADRAATGELVRCEVSSRSLTLHTDQGEGRFVVENGAIIHEGTRQVALADVCANLGHRIKVLYRESGRTRTIYDIRISSRALASMRMAPALPLN